MFDFEKDRITGKSEHVCIQTSVGVLRLVNAGVAELDQPGEKVCLFSGVAIPSLMGLGIMFSTKDAGEDGSHDLDIDDIAFGALYLVASVEEYDNGERKGFIASFSPENVMKACNLFQMIYGREYKLDKILLGLIEAKTANAAKSTPDHLKPFLPH